MLVRALATAGVIVVLFAGCATGSGTPSGTGAPAEECAGHGLPCGRFTSVSGSDSAGDVTWLTDPPVGVEFVRLNGQPTLVVGAPCAPLNIPISVDGSAIKPHKEHTIEGASGCSSSAGDQNAWVRTFVLRPMTIAQDGQRFTLTSGDERMTFAPAS